MQEYILSNEEKQLYDRLKAICDISDDEYEEFFQSDLKYHCETYDSVDEFSVLKFFEEIFDYETDDYTTGLKTVSGSWALSLLALTDQAYFSKEKVVAYINNLDLDDWKNDDIETYDISGTYAEAYSWEMDDFVDFLQKVIRPLQKMYNISNEEIKPFLQGVQQSIETRQHYWGAEHGDPVVYEDEELVIIKKYKEALLQMDDSQYECPFYVDSALYLCSDTLEEAIRSLTTDSYLSPETVDILFDAIMQAAQDTDAALYNQMDADFKALLEEDYHYREANETNDRIAEHEEYLRKEYGITISHTSHLENDSSEYWMDDVETEEDFWEHSI